MKKNRWYRILFTKRLLSILLIFLQLAYLVIIIVNSRQAFRWINLSLNILGVLVALYVLAIRDVPEYKLLWALIITAVPIFGATFYLLFNFQRSTHTLRKKTEDARTFLRPGFGGKEEMADKAALAHPAGQTLLHYLEQTEGFPVYDDTEIEYFSGGESYWEAILRELQKAEKTIWLEYFIIQEGKMWNRILDILKEKAAAGVDVRVLYDDLGCFLLLPSDYPKQLRQMGIRCEVFNPFRPFLSSKQNNRDHRKILSIDGRVAFTGGTNLSDEYINAAGKDFHWKDCGILLRGKAALSLTLIFLQLWSVVSGDDLAADMSLLPTPEEVAVPTSAPIFVQPYGSEPLIASTVGENVYMHMIASAKKSLYIFTPYLIIGDAMLQALCRAAKSGVDVRIVTPGRPDKKLVYITTRSYYTELIAAGVKIYEYTPGFIHSKIMVCDGEMATVGTVNLDFRSLFLHYECGTVLYGSEAVRTVWEDAEATFPQCHLVGENEHRRTFFNTIPRAILRLISPLM
ncbi:MAG: cardiolipin synthase [Clostridia bacterium]|nr:cardiolipin synthase [Clostridia bacterium]